MKTLLFWLVVAVLCGGYYLHENGHEKQVRMNMWYIYIHTNGLALDLRFPRVVTAQSVVETGWYGSTIFFQNHNLFGFKCDKARKFCKEIKNGHAYYESYYESLAHYAAWQKNMISNYERCTGHIIVTESDYISFLGKLYFESCTQTYRYAEDLKYERKLNNIINKYEYDNNNLSRHLKPSLIRNVFRQISEIFDELCGYAFGEEDSDLKTG